MITIEKIWVENSQNTHGGGILSRLFCEIEIDKKKSKLFFECEQKYQKYLVTERADAFVFLLLPVAMREGHDITSKLPITEQLKKNLEEDFIPKLAEGDKTLFKTKILAETESSEIGGEAVGTANSLGVDSFYTICNHAQHPDKNLKITHLYMGSISLDLWGTHAKNLFEYLDKIKYRFERYKLVANELGKELIMTYSNFVEFLCKKFHYVHVTVHAYITLAEIMCMKKLWKTYLFSSSGYSSEEYTLSNSRKNDCSHYEVEISKVVTDSKFQVVCSGAGVSRYEKTRVLADYPPAQKYLHPCFNNLLDNKKHKKEMKNCGRPICQKCLRLLVSADMQGNLDKFKDVVDVEKYRKHKKMYLRGIVWGSVHDPILREIYNACLEKEPKTIKSLEREKNFLTFKWRKLRNSDSTK